MTLVKRVIPFSLLVLFVQLHLHAGEAAAADEARERARLAGVWKGFAVEGTGENPDRGPVKLELTFTEKTIHGIQIKKNGRMDHGTGNFYLDLNANPRQLDGKQVNERGRARAYIGIYTLEGDTLKWCVSPRKVRPTTFETKKGQFLLILKRAEPGFVSLFNGQDLTGWKGDQRIWSVRDGAITGRTTRDIRVTENNFLLWKDDVEDFELKLKFKLEGGNSGIYIRSRPRPPGQKQGEALAGMQADFSADGRWTGVIMEYTLRDILAERGQKVVIDGAGKKQVAGTLGDPKELLEKVKPGEWNDYTVLARGGLVKIAINGVPMAEIMDHDPRRLARGKLALQVHQGPPMCVQFKDIFLRRL
jgi:uncharacterized protein (TIGR03067 family)